MRTCFRKQPDLGAALLDLRSPPQAKVIIARHTVETVSVAEIVAGQFLVPFPKETMTVFQPAALRI